MARLARIVVPHVPHHVTQRGNRRQTVFFCEEDYRLYLDLVGDFARRAGTAIRAYCLMPNHVHLILVPAAPDGLHRALQEAHRRYTRRVNFRAGWRGYLWQGRFASFPLDEPHLHHAVRYVEQNPVRARLAARPEDWPWSSAAARLSGKPDGVVRLDAPGQDSGEGRRLAAAVPEEVAAAIRARERTGRPLGSAAFVARLERITGRSLAKRKPGPRPRRLAEGAAPEKHEN